MTQFPRAVVAAALVAAMSLGLTSQVQAATDVRATTEASASAPGRADAQASNAEVAARYLKQWMFDTNHPHHALRAKDTFHGPGANVNLKNNLTHRFLQHEHQTWGINLGWTDDASAATAVKVSRWFFTRPNNTTRPIRYGDTVALGNGGSPSYIYYAHRTIGINLNWSHTPRFEWKLLGGKIGQEVRSGDWLAIYNTRTKQPLIYFDRTVGGDIGWPDSETWNDQILNAVMRFIRDHWKEGVALLLTTV